MIIKEVRARVIKDSRGTDTISVSVNGCEEASSPNGKSVGDYETRDYYRPLEFCVKFLNNWDEEIEIERFDDLKIVEKAISKKLKLIKLREFGANSLYAFESAILKALAHSKKKQLYEIVGDHRKMPHPVGNVVGGGVHSSSISKRPNFQEFLVIPRSKKFSNDLKAMNYIYSNLKRQLKVKKVNDEGALLVSFDNEEALKAVAKESKKAEAKFGFKIGIGIDVAASTFFDEGKYNYNGSKVDSAEQYKIMRYLIDKYSLFYLEDPAEQHDFKGFAKLNKTKCLIVGDDLTATQYGRVVGAIRTKAINAMIIKPNQNGSLVELRNIFGLCRKHGIKTILSHRSGETMDDAIADYAVGFGADYIKCGVGTQWREVKLNRLKEIERNL